MPSTRRASSRERLALHAERQLADILAVARQDQLDFVIVLAAVQAVEIGDAVDTEQHRLAIDDERAGAVLQRGFDDQRIATRCGLNFPACVEPGSQSPPSTARDDGMPDFNALRIRSGGQEAVLPSTCWRLAATTCATCG
jgi:hypothetical protein